MENDGVQALVIDLRGTGSGAMGEAVNEATVHAAVLVADGLLERGTIGSVRTARGETTYQADSDALFRGWPMAVLVDPATSGAAEWLAAALQDNHRAVIVGSPTRSARKVVARPPGAPQIEEDPGDRLRTDEAVVSDTAVRSAVAVGDSRRWISLVTGYLERGDGRLLADPDNNLVAASASNDRPRGGVHPDHVIPPTVARANGDRRPGDRADSPRKPSERAYAAIEPKGSPRPPSSDPALAAAVTILHQALEKR
jgi:hypothetical protein